MDKGVKRRLRILENSQCKQVLTLKDGTKRQCKRKVWDYALDDGYCRQHHPDEVEKNLVEESQRQVRAQITARDRARAQIVGRYLMAVDTEEFNRLEAEADKYFMRGRVRYSELRLEDG